MQMRESAFLLFPNAAGNNFSVTDRRHVITAGQSFYSAAQTSGSGNRIDVDRCHACMHPVLWTVGLYVHKYIIVHCPQPCMHPIFLVLSEIERFSLEHHGKFSFA